MKGVSFGSAHSYEDLNLILEPFTPTPAEPQTNFLQVPGRDGYLDLTEANGRVKYKSRVFTIPFTVAPWDTKTFDERAMLVSSWLNGRQLKIIFDRDPDYYWFGRLSVDKYEQNKNIGRIVIKATVEPYKMEVAEQNYSYTLTAEEVTKNLTGGNMPVIPKIISTNDTSYIIFNGVKYPLQKGTQRIRDICFVYGINKVTLGSTSGSGTVQFIFRRGWL